MTCKHCTCDTCWAERYGRAKSEMDASVSLIREQEQIKRRIESLEGEIKHIYANYIPWILEQWRKK